MANEEDDPMEVEAVVAEEDEMNETDEDDAAAPAVEVVVAAATEDDASKDNNGGDEEDDDEDNDDDEEEEDNDDEVVVAATVWPERDEEDQEEEEEVVAAVEAAPIVVAEPSPKKSPPKKKRPAAKKKTSETPTNKRDTKASANSTPAAKKKKKKPSSGTKSSSNATAVTEVWPVNPARVDLARDARDHLHEMVQDLPVVLAETQVRSLGQLKLCKGRTPFCTTAALYPIGFSCDRYEFSPVHGRLIQLRCTILDAARVRRLQKERHAAKLWPVQEGPIFRVMWGLGVDEDRWADSAQIPFQALPPIGGPPMKRPPMRPVVDQRVRVRFECKQYYTSTITSVATTGQSFKISIKYDDGFVEKGTPFPDPDITLLTPGEYRKERKRAIFAMLTCVTDRRKWASHLFLTYILHVPLSLCVCVCVCVFSSKYRR